jgi:ADP-ribose pyrophosphatase YjhB (NUDIX family)
MIQTRATVAPLLRWLSTKHNSINLAKKAFPYKQIEEHRQERINTQSEIADLYEANMNMGFKL